MSNIESKITIDEFWKLNFELATRLSNESERGAVLIGTSRVEDFLTELIESILPQKSKAYLGKILNYPAPLSSFSGKIELCYAFRIIDQKLYNSLNTLRKVRNDAAHSSSDFRLINIKEKLNNIAQINDDSPELLDTLVRNHMMNWKKFEAKQEFAQEKYDNMDFETIWNENLLKKETKESLDNQFLMWKLFYSLTFICFSFRHMQETIDKMDITDKTWITYIEKNNNA